MGRKFIHAAIALTLLVLIAGGDASLWVYSQFTRPGPHQLDVTIIIKPGGGLKAIAQQLETGGVIGDALAFQLGARFEGRVNDLHAGEFLIQPGERAREILSVLKSGKTVLRRFTIVEGLTITQIIKQINTTQGLSGEVYFAPPPEGSLLPETYFFSYGEDRQDVVERMRLGMKQILRDTWNLRDADLPLKTAHDALILASIVEKETGLAPERAHVASVFINRLRRNMRLQSDPTVSYGITNGKFELDRPLSRADLKQLTSYNTYMIDGLPPGPISNPGRDAIEAVLHPLISDDLYFVADGTGGHAFAKTLDEHNRNVRKWRKLQSSN